MEGVVTGGPAATAARLDLAGLRVLVTGHTGFKGAWLTEWLLQRGARVTGLALPPDASGSLFAGLRHGERLDHHEVDVRDAAATAAAVRRADPELVFHLAAQALVLRSYREPLYTWETNVTGTLNVLEALRGLGRPVAAVVVTTDKVYRNREWEYAYREDDALGGHDPYSASKAACELAVASWRASYSAPGGVAVATARAGNVVGGGDHAADRIVRLLPRLVGRRARCGSAAPPPRGPGSTCSSPLSGYLALAARLRADGPERGRRPRRRLQLRPAARERAAGRGPRPRARLARAGAALGARRRRDAARGARPRAGHRPGAPQLGWSPRLSFEETAAWTDAGYAAPGPDLPALVVRQIADYEALRAAPAGPRAAAHGGASPHTPDR
jgi:CDP-glucose 4,6-dehydratase